MADSDATEGNGGRAADPLLRDENGKPIPFEQALDELEGLVEQMEAGDLSLEQSVAHFERGMALHRHCQSALEDAEAKVEVLLRRSAEGDPSDLAPFDADNGDPA